MRIHVIQHVPFEGPGLIGEWAAERGHSLDVTLAITERVPAPDDIDLLVVMGGPMAADDEVASPWLAAEKHFIAETIASGQLVLGVCLGAQIVAEVHRRARASRGPPEIGWFPVRAVGKPASRSRCSPAGPSDAVVGHWHGDTFDLPLGMAPVLVERSDPATRRSCSTAAWWVCSSISSGTTRRWPRCSPSARDDLGDGGAYVMSAAGVRRRDSRPDPALPRPAVRASRRDGGISGPRRHEAVAE